MRALVFRNKYCLSTSWEAEMLSVYSISKPTCHILVTDGDGHAIRTIMVKKPYFHVIHFQSKSVKEF